MTNYIQNKNPSVAVKNELTKVERLKLMLEDNGLLSDENGNIDESLVLGMIESETNLPEMIIELDQKISEYEINVSAISLRIKQLSERKERFKNSSDTLRAIILSAMDKAGLKKIESPESTISIKKKPQSVVITDESIIPSQFFENVPKLKKKELTQALKDGEDIKGAELDNGSISLVIRRS